MRKLTIVEVKKQLIEKHNNKYNYSLFNLYDGADTKIKIICPEHGMFKIRANNHLNKQGCKQCANQKTRLRRIKEIVRDKFNGNQMIPSYNPKGCEIFDKISKEKGIHIQHAMNGGEYHIKELGYWVDGYVSINNVVYEFDEKYHKYQKENDIIRENEITNLLECEFIRILDL